MLRIDQLVLLLLVTIVDLVISAYLISRRAERTLLRGGWVGVKDWFPVIHDAFRYNQVSSLSLASFDFLQTRLLLLVFAVTSFFGYSVNNVLTNLHFSKLIFNLLDYSQILLDLFLTLRF